MSKDKMDLLVEHIKNKFKEVECYYLVSIFVKSDDPDSDDFITFGEGPVLEIIASTLKAIQDLIPPEYKKIN